MIVRNMSALELLAAQQTWIAAPAIAMKTNRRPELVPTVLAKLAERGLVDTRSNDENGKFYRISFDGRRHLEEVRTQRRISSFPPMMAFG